MPIRDPILGSRDPGDLCFAGFVWKAFLGPEIWWWIWLMMMNDDEWWLMMMNDHVPYRYDQKHITMCVFWGIPGILHFQTEPYGGHIRGKPWKPWHLQHPAWTQLVSSFNVTLGSCGDPPFEETLTSCGRPWHVLLFCQRRPTSGFSRQIQISRCGFSTLGGIRYQQPIRVNYKHLITILYGKWMYYINDAQCAKNHSNHSWFFVDDRKLPRSNWEMGMDVNIV